MELQHEPEPEHSDELQHQPEQEPQQRRQRQEQEQQEQEQEQEVAARKSSLKNLSQRSRASKKARVGSPLGYEGKDGEEAEAVGRRASDQQVTRSVMQICQVPMRVRRGRCLRKFQCAHEFDISLSVTVEQAPVAKCNIMHCVIGNRIDGSSWPRISVIPGDMMVSIQGAISIDVPPYWNSWVTAEIKATHGHRLAPEQEGQERPYIETVSRPGTNPTWDHQEGLPALGANEQIFFTLWKVSGEDFSPMEARRPLPLKTTGSVRGPSAPVAAVPSAKAAAVRVPRPAPPGAGARRLQADIEALAAESSATLEGAERHLALPPPAAPDGVSTPIAYAWLRREQIFPQGYSGELRLHPVGGASVEDAGITIVQRGRLLVEVRPQPEYRLLAEVQAGTAKQHLLGPPMPFNKEVHATFEVQETKDKGRYVVSLSSSVGEDSKGRVQAEIRGVELLLPKLLVIYVGSPVEPPASAILSRASFRWTTLGTGILPEHQHQRVTFDLPPNERTLLARVQERIDHSKEWRLFDAFFGLVLVCNAVQIGLEIELEHVGDTTISRDTWRNIDMGFILIFIVEILMRFWVMIRRDHRIYVDQWITFDIFIVVLSIFFWFDPDGNIMPFPVSVLRVFRLLKLAKLLRLVRAFHSLGILIESLLDSLYLLFWVSVLLLFVLFICATVLVSLTTFIVEDTPRAASTIRHWRHVSDAMWRLLKATCYDTWAEELRIYFYGVGGWRGVTTGLFLLATNVVTAICIGNMVIGLMCHSAFQLAQNDLRMKSAENLEAKREALSHFRHHLKTFGRRPLFTSDRFITKEELLAAVDPQGRDAEVRHGERGPDGKRLLAMPWILRVLDMSLKDFVGLADVFVENGEIEIEGLVEAIGIVQLQRYFGNLKATDNVIAGKNAFNVRPADMLFFSFSISEVEERVKVSEAHVMSISSLVVDMMNTIDDLLCSRNLLVTLGADNINIGAKAQLIERQWMSNNVTEPMILKPLSDIVEAERDQRGLGKFSIGLDVIFGTVIILNGIFTGIQTTYEDPTSDRFDALMFIDLGFAILFTIEILLRWFLFADILEATDRSAEQQMEEEMNAGAKGNLNKSAKEGILRLQRSMIFGIFPPYPQRGGAFLWSCLAGFLSNIYQLVDLIIVIICVLDVSFFFFFRSIGWWEFDAGVFSVIRLFRLMRLVKLLRVLRIFPQLQQLVYVVMSMGRLVTWTLMIILLVLHVFAILTVIIYGQNPEMRFEQYFGGFFDCMITGWQFLTLDAWPVPMDLYEDTHGSFASLLVVLLFCAMLVAGLILMNMAVGVMCSSALGFTQRTVKDKSYEQFLHFVTTMQELVDLFQEKLGSRTMTQDMIERGLTIKMRAPRPVYDSRRAKVARDLSQEVLNRVDQDFLDRFQHIIHKARLLPMVVKNIFEKMDYERQGYLNVHRFIEGALVLKADLAKLDLYSYGSAVRLVRMRCQDVTKRLYLVRHKIDTFMQLLSALLRVSEFDEAVLNRPMLETPHNLMRLGSDGEKARVNVIRWSQEGSNHPLRGRLLVKPGVGRMRVSNDFQSSHAEDRDDKVVFLQCEDDARSNSTVDLRHQVEPGELVVLETLGSRGGNVGCFGVQVVINKWTMRCHAEQPPMPALQAWCTYYIISVDKDADAAVPGEKDSGRGDLRPPAPNMSPQDAQRLFEWEVDTMSSRQKTVLEVQKKVAGMESLSSLNNGGSTGGDTRMQQVLGDALLKAKEAEKRALSEEHDRLVLELVRLVERSTIFKCFASWREKAVPRNWKRHLAPI